jgi:hypothetical protein
MINFFQSVITFLELCFVAVLILILRSGNSHVSLEIVEELFDRKSSNEIPAICGLAGERPTIRM